MDRRRRRAPALALAALAIAGTASAAGDAVPPLLAMRWAPGDADPHRAFATEPAECLKAPADPRAAVSVEVGRAAFRSPLVLGGQAARAGLSCESCHRSGRGNPDFLFPGISGAPGTADVTHSLFSSHRGDGVQDPKPIPDLAGPRERLKVAPAELKGFIRGLVVEEFDGPEPSPALLQGLVAYVAALDPAACPAEDRRPVTVASLLGDARRALRAGQAVLATGDRGTALAMVAAARARLGLIDERFADLPQERTRLRRAAAGLGEVQEIIRAGGPGAQAALETWLADSRVLEAALAAREGESLFDPARLVAAYKRRLPQGAS